MTILFFWGSRWKDGQQVEEVMVELIRLYTHTAATILIYLSPWKKSSFSKMLLTSQKILDKSEKCQQITPYLAILEEGTRLHPNVF